MSTFTTNYNLQLQAVGENPNTWGTVLNTNVITLLDNILGSTFSVSVAGSADYSITQANASNANITATGLLTGNINFIFPAAMGGKWIFFNNTTGAFSITVKTSGGTGVIVPQGDRFIVSSDGANMYFATTTRVAQVVNTETGAVATGTTVIPQADSIPTNTQGDQYMSLAITPTNTNSTLVIDVVFIGAAAVTGTTVTVALFQDTTANALACASLFQQISSGLNTIAFRHKMTAGTTSATTFKVRAGPGSAATLTFNGQLGGRLYGGVLASSITITEVLP